MKILESEVVRKSITVELSPEDIDVIYFALNLCGGSPEGPRGLASVIRNQLYMNGAKQLKCSPDFMHYYADTWEYES